MSSLFAMGGIGVGYFLYVASIVFWILAVLTAATIRSAAEPTDPAKPLPETTDKTEPSMASFLILSFFRNAAYSIR
jgi:hypothetical protein